MVKKRGALLALLLAFALVMAACGDDDDAVTTTTTAGTSPTTTTATTEPPAEALSVGLVYDIGGRGDQSFNDSAAAGLDQAKTEYGIEATELEPAAGGENRAELLNLVSEDGSDLVIGVGFLFAEAMAEAAANYPDVNFGIVDSVVDAPNVRGMVFAEHEGSFLVGAAAALKSTTGRVGFIGGVEIDLIKKFEAGFIAGAQFINPDIQIDIKYISQPPDFSGFGDPAKGQEIATGMFDAGADIVYHAAGGSGGGLFAAAKAASEATGDQHWAIGVDSDQYLTAGPEFQPYILTSMLKRVDVAVYSTISDAAGGMFSAGVVEYGLAVDGVGYATSGGFVDDIAAQLDDLKGQVISGAITVPVVPGEVAIVNPVGSPENPIQVLYVPSVSAEEIVAGGELLAEQLNATTGLTYEVVVPTSYAATVEAMCASPDNTIGFIPAQAYVLANQLCGVEVGLKSIRYGFDVYWTQFIVPRDSDIQTFEDLEGKTWAYPDATSTSGFLFPSGMFASTGVTPGEGFEAGGHSAVARAIYNREADFGTTFYSPPIDADYNVLWDGTIENADVPADIVDTCALDADGQIDCSGTFPRDARRNIREEAPDVVQMVRIVTLSPDIPNDLMTFGPEFSADTADAVMAAMLDFADTDPDAFATAFDAYSWSGVAVATDAEIDPVRILLDAIGYNIEDLG